MKNALVTGASGGIGAEIARVLSKKGYRVFVNYNTHEQEAFDLAREICGTAVRADVSNRTQVFNMFASIGRVDLLVCNAGISLTGLFTDVTPIEWRRVFGVNVDGVYNCCQAVLPQMVREKEGRIITVSSMWGQVGASCEVAYSASKAAVIGFTKALAKEVGPSGITVNCVCPGVIDTPMNAHLSEEDIGWLREDTPLMRIGTPRDIAETVAFLASDAASFITGQIIGVNGGFII